MSPSDYDKSRLKEILAGEGSWYTARLLRAINDLLPHADLKNRERIRAAFPEETELIIKYWEEQS